MTLINDHFQNFKVYQIPKAQLIIADIPFNLGNYAYASNPSWAAENLNRKAFGFEIKKPFFRAATEWIEANKLQKQEIKEFGYAKTKISEENPILF